MVREKSLKRPSSKTVTLVDQQMTMKAHLQGRFVRERPRKGQKMISYDDVHDYAIRTITE